MSLLSSYMLHSEEKFVILWELHGDDSLNKGYFAFLSNIMSCDLIFTFLLLLCFYTVYFVINFVLCYITQSLAA